MTKHILLVNPIASTKYLSNRFKEYGVFTIALYTLDLSKLSSYFLPHPDLFAKQIFCQSDNLHEIIAKLGNYQFDYVINGFEASVRLSDELAEYYIPQYANDPNTYLLRCDKYEMHKALAKNNLAHIKQIIYNVTDNHLPQIADYGISYPCFVKPLAAAARFGACKINNYNELKEYFINPQKYNSYYQNASNQGKFLIAELVVGEEVLINTFSLNGKHYISTVQKYCCNYTTPNPICEYWEIVRDKKQIEIISDYIGKVLTATGFNNGLAHTELFLLPDNSVKLIEINPRIAGGSGFSNKLNLLDAGFDQISLLMKYVFDYDYVAEGDGFYSRALVLYNLSGKPLNNLKANLTKYPSVYEFLQLVADGHIAKSIDEINITDAAAFVLIRDRDLTILDQESAKILAQDKVGWE